MGDKKIKHPNTGYLSDYERVSEIPGPVVPVVVSIPVSDKKVKKVIIENKGVLKAKKVK
jgi:hypothetical protein